MKWWRRRQVVGALCALLLTVGLCVGLLLLAPTARTPSPRAGPASLATTSAVSSSPEAVAPDAANREVLALLDTLPVKGKAAMTGYSRAQFQNGGVEWGDPDGNRCDARNDVLRRDLDPDAPVPGSRCLVATGTLIDPYTGKTITFMRGTATSGAVQIDHVVALGNAWVTGAQQISKAQRVALANDPLNLRAVDGPTNGAKGDRDASAWLPPRAAGRCEYVARQVAVKARYALWVTSAEAEAMRRVAAGCPTTGLPAGSVGK